MLEYVMDFMLIGLIVAVIIILMTRKGDLPVEEPTEDDFLFSNSGSKIIWDYREPLYCLYEYYQYKDLHKND
ncbi:hypothetical protein OWM07_01880 [Deferribacter thermophilus]|uniref:hypothetical protein n=1 Tax=Deferribacter thermophilus TaxID=53573 RepID=UPI003C13EEA8